jgi:GDP/UDP-N,N'-diacetylbacillosamine 2-epimerase (hydrolysing)
MMPAPSASPSASPSPSSAPRRSVVFLSGTRADFGLMQSTLLQAAQQVDSLDVSVAVTGMHLDTRFGHTVDAIAASGLRICARVPIDVHTRSAQSMAAAVGQCLQGLAPVLTAERPDILVLLGDRGEMLAGAIAALHQGVVTLHVHGGERSGTVDEPIRHAISKLCTYHAVATEASRERLVRMGEKPEHIWVTGGPGLDGLHDLAATTEADCRAALGLPSAGDWGLVLFHPVVQQASDAYAQTVALCRALRAAKLPVLWTEPNADAGSLGVLQALDEVELPAGSQRALHVPRDLFCAAMRHCTVMLGNSSAGIIEAASFGTPVLNIGDRQNLRERNLNVVDAPATEAAMAAGLQTVLAAAQGRARGPGDNLYGSGHAGQQIVELLQTVALGRGVLEKTNAY